MADRTGKIVITTEAHTAEARQELGELKTSVEGVGEASESIEGVNDEFSKLKDLNKEMKDTVTETKDEMEEMGKAAEKANIDAEKSAAAAAATYKALGKKILAVVAAFVAGWTGGMKVNDELKRDMREWDALLAKLGDVWKGLYNNFNLLISGWVSMLLAQIQPIIGAFESMRTLSIEPLKQSFKDAWVEFRDGASQALSSVTKFGDAAEKEALRTGAIRRQSIEVTEEVTEATEAAAEATDKLTEAKSVLAEELHTVNIALTEETAKLIEQATSKALVEFNDSLNNVQFGAAIKAAELLTESFAKLETQALKTKRALDALSGSTDGLTGEESEFGPGISIKRSGSDVELKPGDKLTTRDGKVSGGL